MADGPWQTFWSRKAARAQRKAVSEEAKELVKEIYAGMFGKPPGGKNGRPGARKPEWSCTACSKLNFMDRQRCRGCGGTKPASAADVHATPPSGAARSTGPASTRNVRDQPPARPPTRVQQLEQAVAAARDGGVAEAIVASLEGELQAAKNAAADSRPIGARLDSAQAKASRAARALEAAEAAVVAAEQRRDAAKIAVQQAEKELASLSKAAESVTTAPSEERAVVSRARALLDSLEGSWLGDTRTGSMPEPLLDHIHGLRAALDAEAPLPELVMELDEDGTAAGTAAGEPLADSVGDAYVATQLGTEEASDEDMEAIAVDLLGQLDEVHQKGSGDEAAIRIIRESLSSAMKGSGKGKASDRYEPHRVA